MMRCRWSFGFEQIRGVAMNGVVDARGVRTLWYIPLVGEVC